MHDYTLDDVLVVDMKLQSLLAEWADVEKTTCPRVDPDLSKCKDFCEDIEEIEINLESHKIFQNSSNKFNKLSKFKLRPRWP